MKQGSRAKDKGSKPNWPSLEQQLANASVIPGSALEQLIRDNQDFAMLWPHEADDRLRIPPWLRVYWRKNHPEGRYAEHDPSGGYPMALHELYEWMIHHQDLKPPQKGQK